MSVSILKRGLLIACGLIIALKICLAWQLPLLGDEAFYWWESRFLAWSFSDLPPLTAWTIRAATVLSGETGSYLSVRWPFLLAGCLALPLSMQVLGRTIGLDGSRATLGALIGLAVPLTAATGLLATPDALLLALSGCWLLAVVRAVNRPSALAWLAVGLLAAMGLACHPRFLILGFCIALGFLVHPAGRKHLTTPGPWCALGVASIGLILPAALGTDADAMWAFQASERHPWTFQWAGLLQPLVQAIIVTPILYGLLVWATWKAAVDKSIPIRLDILMLVLAAAGPALIFLLVGLFADNDRVGFHWPAFSYPVAAILLVRIACNLRVLAAGLGIAVAVAASVPAGMLVMTQLDPARLDQSWLPENLLGWDRVAATITPAADESIVADNFLLGSELAFEWQRSDIQVMEHPLNAYHGRAAQLVQWDLLVTNPSTPPDWVVVEETALDADGRPAWARHVCEIFPDAALAAETTQLGGRRRIRWYSHREGAKCQHPPFLYLDSPNAEAVVEPTTMVTGWAFDDDRGIDQIAVLVDGTAIARLQRNQLRADVANFFGGSSDPDTPMLGFSVEVTLAPGSHELIVVATARDGETRPTRPRRIHVRD